MQRTRTEPDDAQLQALEVEEQQAVRDRTTVWGFIWVLFLFKVGTVVATMWAAGLTSEATYLLSVTTWPWLVIPGIALSGPLLFRYRLRRVRARRAALQRSEWLVNDG
ncbi:hypothetical protein BH23CHL4_BH23CHL4_00240 [soil metagenome]